MVFSLVEQGIYEIIVKIFMKIGLHARILLQKHFRISL
jgi:hypothetical protein